MTDTLSPLFAVLLTVFVGLAYAVATVGMKLCAEDQMRAGAAILAVGLACVVLGEVILLRTTTLSVLYVSIVAVETLLVLGYAVWIGEGFGVRQAAGAALVLVGLAVVTA